MFLGLHGPRQVVAKTRRVCLPSAITDELGWVKGGSWVRVRTSSSAQELVVEAADQQPTSRRDRDPDRPRPLDHQGQVTLPAPLMSQVGLSPSEPWVYFARAGRRRAVRIIPQRLALTAWTEIAQ